MKHFVSHAALAAALSLMPMAPANGQTTDASPSATEQATQDLKDQLALTQAKAELFKAETESFQARIDALGLPKPEGKTELAETGGKIETWMLSARTINKAARQINAVARPPVELDEAGKPLKSPGKTLLLDSTTVLDMGAPFVLRREMQAYIGSMDGVLARCPTDTVTASSVGVTAIIGAILPLLRTDTKISGFVIDTAEGALINAIAGYGDGRYVVPSELVLPDQQGETLVQFGKLLEKREALRPCATQFAAKSPELALLEAVATRVDAYAEGLVQRKDSKPGRLEAAMLSDALSKGQWDVLRVKVEQAGGSIFKRSNLFTALGAPAIGITGGLVVSWRLSTPSTGAVTKAGLLVCRTKLTNFNAIHKGNVNISNCDTTDN